MHNKLGFMILHTGVPYLRYAIQSILPQVDKLMIFYSEMPSQGFQTDIPCPDTKAELMSEAFEAAKTSPKTPVHWVDGEWANETDHVNEVWECAEGYDWVYRIDADEITPSGMVDEMIRQANAQEYHFKEFSIPFAHGWRSFSRCCRDGSHPIRLTRVNGGE